jgi:DNA excision repair protein ERCC-6
LFGDSVQVKQDSKGKRKVPEQDDLSHLESLDKIREFEPEAKTSEKEDDNSRILSELFSTTGVHSALKHDDIVGASRPEALIVEKEAGRVAQEAANALRLSRKRVRQNQVFEPTWTGKQGRAGAPQRPRFGMKPSSEVQEAPKTMSSMILNNLKQGPLSEDTTSNAQDVLEKIRNYLGRHSDSKAYSADLVAEFESFIASRGMPLFRKLLKQIADFTKEDDQGYWKLKDDFI